MHHSILWQAPAPLWSRALQDSTRRRYRRPALLRFASDDFMEALQQQITEEAETIAETVARNETWREPKVGWLPETADDPDEPVFEPDTSIRLYQPVHKRYYLVAAQLVCQVRGLPDKTVSSQAKERAGFVVRRLALAEAKGASQEYAWIEDGARWEAVSEPFRRQEGEELLPLSSLVYGSAEERRRLFVGLIPVARRQVYEGARLEAAVDDLPESDIRLAAFASVAQTFTALHNAIDHPEGKPSQAVAVEGFTFALLNLAEFLSEHLRSVWAAIDQREWTNGPEEQHAVFSALEKPIKPGLTWREALREVWSTRTELLEGGAPDLPFDRLQHGEIGGAIARLGFGEEGSFRARVEAALIALPEDEAVSEDEGEAEASGEAAYVVRCVYERPRCPDSATNPIVSAPTQPFTLAPFFDGDAPARNLRIAMPDDTSPGGLRKFPKNVSVALKKQLRRQVERVQDARLEDLDEGDVEKGSAPSLGVIYVMSIPIITICALILLLVMVNVLNFVFWWLPYFKIAIPIKLSSN